MRCVKPLTIRHPQFEDATLQVPCGNCAYCKQDYRRMWQIRLDKESQYCLGKQYFLTLTYEIEPQYVNKKDIQLFLKRLRKSIEPYKLRYYAVSERGEKFGRIHWHMLLFTNCISDIGKHILEAWNNGFIFVGSVTGSSINYVLKYVLKDSADSKVLMSQSPGIGYQYTQNEQVKLNHYDNPRRYIQLGKYRSKLPRYFLEKLYKQHKPEVPDDVIQRSINFMDTYQRIYGTIDENNLRTGVKTMREQESEYMERLFNRKLK